MKKRDKTLQFKTKSTQELQTISVKGLQALLKAERIRYEKYKKLHEIKFGLILVEDELLNLASVYFKDLDKIQSYAVLNEWSEYIYEIKCTLSKKQEVLV